MKTISYKFVAVAMTAGALAVAATVHVWPNRAQVIRAGEVLAKESERLDEKLHDAKAPVHLVKKAHHFEQGIREFIKVAKGNGTYDQALAEFSHVRADALSIEQDLMATQLLAMNPKLAEEWRHVWTSYRALDHEMYAHFDGSPAGESEEERAAELTEPSPHD